MSSSRPAPTGGSPEPASRFGHATLGVPPPVLEMPAEPAAPGRSQTQRAVLAGVLALLLLLGAFLLGRAPGGRGQVEVWQLRRDLAAGSAVTLPDLAVVEVSRAAAPDALPATGVPPSSIAREDLRSGQLLLRSLIARGTPLPSPGNVLVGIAAPAGAVPDGLRAGSFVAVYRLPVTSAQAGQPPALDRPARMILGRVQVYSVTAAGQSSVVTLVVPALAAPGVTALNAQSRIALVALGD